MREWVLAVVISVALTASGAAQLRSVTQSRVFLANGDPLHPVWRESIRNSGTSSIVAFHAKFRCSPQSTRQYDGQYARSGGVESFYDPLVNFGGDPEIGAGQSIEVSAADRKWCWGGVDAALFSDGHAEGDPDQVENMYARRKGVSEQLRVIHELLEEGAAGQLTTQQIVERLGVAAVLNLPGGSEGRAEFEGESVAWTTVRTMLQSQSIWGVPSESTAQRKPRVEQVMSQRGVPREQAYLVVTAMKVQEWQDAMQGNVKPPKFHWGLRGLFP